MSGDFSRYRTSSLFCTFVQKLAINCLPDSNVQEKIQQSDGSCNAASNAGSILEKSLFNSAKIYKKHIASKDICISHHDAEMGFSPICTFHILLLGYIEEMLQNLVPLFFTYTHVVSLHWSSIGSIEKLLSRVVNCLIICKKQFVLVNRVVYRMPIIARKALEVKLYKAFIELLPKTK